MTNNNIMFVANLQVYSTPFAALYVDTAQRVLYLFMRVSSYTEQNPDYAVVDVSSQDIDSYMKKRKTLSAIYHNPSVRRATIINDNVNVYDDYVFIPPVEMKRSNRFDPEFCYDTLKIKAFLRKFNSNQV